MSFRTHNPKTLHGTRDPYLSSLSRRNKAGNIHNFYLFFFKLGNKMYTVYLDNTAFIIGIQLFSREEEGTRER